MKSLDSNPLSSFSNDEIIELYVNAVNMDLEIEFVDFLEEEIDRRNLNERYFCRNQETLFASG